MSWLLNFLYAGLLIASAPWWMFRAWKQGRYRRGWGAKLFGALPPRAEDGRPLIWFHAVSVGEVLLLQPLLARLASERPDVQVVVSTSTDAGYDVARTKAPDCRIVWQPLDFSWGVKRALRRVRPDLYVLVELELWPNLIAAVERAAIPLLLINGRLSERSARGYVRIRPLVRRWLSCFTAIAVQSDEYRQRLLELGAAPETVCVTGSVKFDGAASDRNAPEIAPLRRALGIRCTAPVFIAGSTQAPEEEAAIDAWQAARTIQPDLRLVLVPRSPERFDETAQLVRERNFRVLRRSEQRTGSSVESVPFPDDASAILLIDTIGELSTVWGLADIAYVGGSLTPGRGGQNMYEPAGYGAAVLFGPHTENFRAGVELLLAARGAVRVQSAAELAEALQSLLQNPERRRALGERAREVVEQQRGATERTLQVILSQLGATPARAQSIARRAA